MKPIEAPLVAVLALLALGACDRGPDPAPGGPASARSVAASPAVSARRPSRRYFLGRADDRCEVYAVDDGGVTPATWTPCPIDLLPGEHIRIAGNTCVRESADAARQIPVVCPDPLTNLEKRDRALAR